MAISPKNLYPSRVIDGDGAYPYGKALNVQNGVEGTGTPLEAEWLNDLWGSQQALLADVGIAPNGQPDSVGNSQYLDALKKLIREPLELKIFQSPSSGGLTEIQTRTVDAGEVYEVRKTSDDSLATIYSDAAGTTEIVQNGTANVSNGDAEAVFYIADGNYNIAINAVSVAFLVGVSTDNVKIAQTNKTMANYINSVHVRDTANSTGDSFIFNYDKGNDIASDLSSCMIGAGGYGDNQNLIGFIKPSESFIGNGSTKVFNTAFTELDTLNVRVELVRADGVRLGVTYKDSILIEIDGGTVKVTYPIDGHFVNNASGGTEGSDPFLSADETLLISTVVAQENLGSNSHLCAIYGGYDNVIKSGIMQQISGAHHRINGGDHNTVVGGSYAVVNQGSYGTIYGGTNNKILNVGNVSGAGIFGGAGNTVDLNVGWVLGGIGGKSSGAFSTVLGGLNNTASGNGAVVAGRDNIASGQDSLSIGKENTASGVYSFTCGLRNNSSGPYASSFGRDNNTVGEYAQSFGYLNSASGNYSQCFGVDSRTRWSSEQALGMNKSAVQGDSQSSVINLKRTTTSATATRLTTSTFENLILDSGECWAFRALIVGKRTDATGEVNSFEIKGTVDNSTGTAVIVGTPTVTDIGSGTSPWTVAAEIGGSNDFQIDVAGEAGKTISWMCRLELAMVI